MEFYVQAPKLGPGEGRADALKLGLGVNVVPAGTKVKWGGLK